jgi:leucyl aminopeptidase
LVRIGVRTSAPSEASYGLLAAGVFEGDALPDALRTAGDFSGRRGETALLYPRDEISASRLLLVGLGERASFTAERLRRTAATVARRARSLGVSEAALVLPEVRNAGVDVSARAAAEGAALGLYRFDRYKSKKRGDASGANRSDDRKPESLDLLVERPDDEAAASRGARTGEKLAAAAVLARDLANEPSNTATPEYLAEAARTIAERHGMEVTVLDRGGIEVEGLVGLATVGRSASNEPRFIVLEHRRGGDEDPVVLVGKAVTFDSGGISIKPTAGMEDMKFDMSGGAAVLGAMEAVGAPSYLRPRTSPAATPSSPATCSPCRPARPSRSSRPTPRGA